MTLPKLRRFPPKNKVTEIIEDVLFFTSLFIVISMFLIGVFLLGTDILAWLIFRPLI